MALLPLPLYNLAGRASSPDSFSLMLEALGRGAREDFLLGLVHMRLIACTSFANRALMYESLHVAVLDVKPADATWDNAHYVARRLVPGCGVPVRVLRMAGEGYLPEMRLGELAQLSRLKVGTLGVPAAIFFGYAIARSSDCTLRLSDGVSTRHLRGLRESANVKLPASTTNADAAALLGALSLNPHFDFLEGVQVTDPLLAAACEAALIASVSAGPGLSGSRQSRDRILMQLYWWA
jgi:hypothetical protein